MSKFRQIIETCCAQGKGVTRSQRSVSTAKKRRVWPGNKSVRSTEKEGKKQCNRTSVRTSVRSEAKDCDVEYE